MTAQEITEQVQRVPAWIRVTGTIIVLFMFVFGLGATTTDWKSLPKRVDRLEAQMGYQMCRSLQIDAGQDPSGCQRAYGIDPAEYVPAQLRRPTAQ